MAKATLPTNYRDDILNVSTEGKRKYRMNYNDDGTVSFVDVTPYDQEGSDFGAGDINATNEAVNQSLDKAKVIDDLETIQAVTNEGFVMGALAGKELNDSLNWKELGTIQGSNVLNQDFIQYKEISLLCDLYNVGFFVQELPTMMFEDTSEAYTVVLFNGTYGVCNMAINLSKTSISIHTAISNNNDSKEYSKVIIYAR